MINFKSANDIVELALVRAKENQDIDENARLPYVLTQLSSEYNWLLDQYKRLFKIRLNEAKNANRETT